MWRLLLWPHWVESCCFRVLTHCCKTSAWILDPWSHWWQEARVTKLWPSTLHLVSVAAFIHRLLHCTWCTVLVLLWNSVGGLCCTWHDAQCWCFDSSSFALHMMHGVGAFMNCVRSWLHLIWCTVLVPLFIVCCTAHYAWCWCFYELCVVLVALDMMHDVGALINCFLSLLHYTLCMTLFVHALLSQNRSGIAVTPLAWQSLVFSVVGNGKIWTVRV